MGLKPSGELRKRIRDLAAAKVAANPSRFKPVAGRAVGFVPGEPPTVTHHDKRITSRGFGKMKLVDSAALTAARAEYLGKIPQRAGPPVAGPLSMLLQFCWSDAALAQAEWWTKKPDADNAAKVITDMLCLRGWIGNDAHVADLRVRKVALSLGSQAPAGVYIDLCTLTYRPTLWAAAGGICFTPYETGGDQ